MNNSILTPVILPPNTALAPEVLLRSVRYECKRVYAGAAIIILDWLVKVLQFSECIGLSELSTRTNSTFICSH